MHKPDQNVDVLNPAAHFTREARIISQGVLISKKISFEGKWKWNRNVCGKSVGGYKHNLHSSFEFKAKNKWRD